MGAFSLPIQPPSNEPGRYGIAPRTNPYLAEIDAAAGNAHAVLSPGAQEALRRAGAPIGITQQQQPQEMSIAKPNQATVKGIAGTPFDEPGAEPGPQDLAAAPAISAPTTSAHIATPPAIQPVPNTPEMAPAQKELNRLTIGPESKTGREQLHIPWARIPLGILEAIGTGFAPGLTSAIPGTQLHHNMLVGEAENAVGQQEKIRENEEKARLEAANEEHLGGETEHNLAQAEALRNPKTLPEKEDVHAIYAEAVRDAMRRGVNPVDDPKVQQTLAAVTALNKEPAPSKPDVHVLLAEAIQDAQKRNVDPKADPHVQQITEAIRATAAAPNDTEVIHKQVGGKPHNVMVKKGTGEVVADLGELGEKESTAETGTSTLEELNGKPVFVNNKTQRVTPAPEGLAKSGTAEKKEAAVKPIRDAVTFGRTYLDSGQFNGSEDKALIDKASQVMDAGTKRPPSPAQQKTIMESRSATQGAAAIAKHYLNPEAPWLDDHQRANLVKAMEDIAKSEGIEAPKAEGAGGAAATHRYNPATGKIEPIGNAR